MERWMGIFGLGVLFLVCFLLSNNKRRINLRTVVVGFALQWFMAILLLKWPMGNQGLQWVSSKVVSFLGLVDHGTRFLFGKLSSPELIDVIGFQLALRILPIIIFFAAFMGILYYIGIMPRVVQAFAWVMSRLMKTSGSESLSSTAEIFVGPTEAPLLIRPYLARCTVSELNAIMVAGFGTIAGSVMAAYVSMGISAEHIMIASCMAAPASLMIAKILFPETEHSETAGDVRLPKLDVGVNLLDATARGVTDGLHLALNVAAMLIAFITLVAFADKILGYFDRLIDGQLLGYVIGATGEYSGFFPGSLKTIFGTIFSPLAFVMGIPRADIVEVGNLLGLKISLNEFVAYAHLSELIKQGVLSEKTVIMTTYMLCGFANFGSIGIAIGGLSALAPERRSDFARLALKAMFGGAIVSCMTATIVGLLL
ncbi:MAG: NupC/NupG family nucleoside CNT transporter [Deltaproteobacteria bacterium]|nr:NupC/NupG family nucleoside CNT transporter [Deltaproteobacteria bacterium]